MSAGGETVSPLNIRGWVRFPLRERLQRQVGLPVVVDNDAKALALGEGWLGAAQGSANYLAMVVSTGVGGGIVLDGRLLDGGGQRRPHRPPGGRAGRSTLRLRGSGLPRGRGVRAVDRVDDRASRRPGARTPCADAAGPWSAGRWPRWPTSSTSNWPWWPGSVALGYGGVFFEAAQEEIARRSQLDFSRSTRIVPGGLGAQGPLVGAAAVGHRALRPTDQTGDGG